MTSVTILNSKGAVEEIDDTESKWMFFRPREGQTVDDIWRPYGGDWKEVRIRGSLYRARVVYQEPEFRFGLYYGGWHRWEVYDDSGWVAHMTRSGLISCSREAAWNDLGEWIAKLESGTPVLDTSVHLSASIEVAERSGLRTG